MATMIARHAAKTVTIALLFAVASPAIAAPTSARRTEATKAWRRGKRLYSAGRCRAAMVSFLRGHRISGRGGFLFNAAEAARVCRDRSRALALYRRYLADYRGGRYRSRAMERCRRLAGGGCMPVAPAAGTSKATTDGKRPSATTDGPPAAARSTAEPPATNARRASASVVARAPSFTPLARQTLSPVSTTPIVAEVPRPLYRHWGLWVGIGAAVIAGSVTAIVLATRSSDPPLPDHHLFVDLNR